MICFNCQNLDLLQFPRHAKVGMGKCKLEKMTGVFVSILYERDCKDYKEALPATVRAREVFINGGT